MCNCPTELELTRYIEESASDAERIRMDAHLQTCPECKRLWNDLLELKQASHAGSLPTVTESERNAALEKLTAHGLFQKDERKTLGAFFRGLIDIAEAKQLLLDNPLLARDTSLSLENENQRVIEEHLCALRCEAILLAQAGFELEDSQLLDEAIAEGWFLPGQGTPLVHLGKMLTRYGLEVERYQRADINVLRHALESGYQVIAAVDSGELQENSLLVWFLERLEDLIAWIPDHCLIVSGVIRKDDEDFVVVLDPNKPGESRTIPAADFMEAWEDSGFFLLAARRRENQ